MAVWQIFLKIILRTHELWNLEIASASYRRHDFTILEILTLTWKIIWIIILEVSNQQDMAVWQIFLKIILRTHEIWNLEIASASYRRHDLIILKIMTLTQNRILIIPVWYNNKITIIDFTIYTQLFLVKLKRVVDGPFQYGILIILSSYFAKNTNFCFTV